MSRENQNGASTQILRFVRDPSSLSSKVMRDAFFAVTKAGISATWISVEEAAQMCQDKTEHMFVLEKFIGDLFDQVVACKHRVYGPMCILASKPGNRNHLPIRKWPIHNICMRRVVLTSSGIKSEELRQDIEDKVQLMGGLFCKSFPNRITHVVAESLSTKKSRLARELGIPVVDYKWMAKCWEVSQTEIFDAAESALVNKYRLPIFHQFYITVSQVGREERRAIKSVVEKNGGTYSGDLDSKHVTHLMLKEASGDKYKLVKNIKDREVFIVNTDWLADSLKKGYAVNEEDYKVSDASCVDIRTAETQSPPPKPLELVSSKLVTDTKLATTTIEVSSPMVAELEEYCQKNCNPNLFDGYDFLIVGCTGQLQNLMKQLAQKNGGYASDKWKESITHILVGPNMNPVDEKALQEKICAYGGGCLLLKIDWLVASVKENRPVNVKTYLKSTPETVKNLDTQEFQTLSRREPTMASVSVNGDILNCENDIVKEYEKLDMDCEEHSDHENLPATARETLLKDLIITLSSFPECEKEQLTNLILSLGGVCQEHFCKVDEPTKNIKRNTHLIVDEPVGKKYEAAKRWGIHCVTKQWLLESEKSGIIADERLFATPSVKQTVKEKRKVDLSNPNKATELLDQLKEITVSLVTKGVKPSPVSSWEVDEVPFAKPVDQSVLQRKREMNVNGISNNFEEDSHLAVNADFPASLPITWREKKRAFMCSGYENEEKLVLQDAIRDLGGVLNTGPEFEPTCGHLIMRKPIKNEKLFCSIASGKWVLHDSYITDSHQHGRFLSEEDYEYGGPRQSEWAFTESYLPAAAAARRWRIKLEDDASGAFDGWRVIVISATKGPAFANIIKHGGGEAFVFTSLDQARSYQNLTDIDFAIVDLPKRERPDAIERIRPLREMHIECIVPDYLSAFLLNDPPPVRSDFNVVTYQKSGSNSLTANTCSNGSTGTVFSSRLSPRQNSTAELKRSGVSSSENLKRSRLAVPDS